MKKIYIVGCAKTGTTLLRRLFNAFEGLKVCDHEIEFNDFMDSDYNVGKRDAMALFSNLLSRKDEAEKVTSMHDSDCLIVYINRNKEDVLKSGFVSKKRYEECKTQAFIYSFLIDSYIDYELLIDQPNNVQKQFAMDLNLKIKHKFSDYPDFIEDDNMDYGSYKLRKIGEKI